LIATKRKNKQHIIIIIIIIIIIEQDQKGLGTMIISFCLHLCLCSTQKVVCATRAGAAAGGGKKTPLPSLWWQQQ